MPSFKFVGDKGILIEFAGEISKKINEKVRSMDHSIQKANFSGIQEIIPTYRSLLILFDPLKTDRNMLMQRIKELDYLPDSENHPEPRRMIIPVKYGGKFGPDLNFVADHNGLTRDEVIDIHTGQDYRVYMLGFTPGFPYLGGMSKEIAAPRLDSPREEISKGSVGIAGDQTGIYPLDSPGGWRLIGRTPLELFAPEREEPILFKVGDILNFESISQERYDELREKIVGGEFDLASVIEE